MKRTADEAAATRDALLDAALLEFADHGYRATKLADVAARAGVTRGAAYHHFADKAELYRTVVATGWDRLTVRAWRTLDADAVPEPMDRLRAFIVDLLDVIQSDERFRALLIVSMVRPEGYQDPRTPTDAELAAKAQGMGAWSERIAAACAAAGSRTPRRAAARLLTWINGFCVSVAFTPAVHADAGEPAEIADYLLEGLL